MHPACCHSSAAVGASHGVYAVLTSSYYFQGGREGGKRIPPVLFLASAEEGCQFDKLAGFLFMLVLAVVAVMRPALQWPPS